MERWPAELLDPEIERIAQKLPCSECPPDILCQYCSSDWHSLRLTKDYAIVAGVMIPRVIAFPFDGNEPIEFPLSPRDENRSMYPPLDIELDQTKNKIWVLDRGQELVELTLEKGEFHQQMRYPLPELMSFSYFSRSEEHLMITSVHVEGDAPRRISILEQPSIRHLKDIEPRHNGHQIPMPRDALWVPSLEKLILAPDFGSHLYLTDINTGDSTPWLAIPTMNGKMIWLPKSGHIMLALPNRFETWRIDPITKEIVNKISTQPGVRTLAVDEDRGLLVTASVLTGQIWIQNLEDGSLLKSLGTVMPMVRQLKLEKDRGIGVLTTWVDVYRFSYLP